MLKKKFCNKTFESCKQFYDVASQSVFYIVGEVSVKFLGGKKMRISTFTTNKTRKVEKAFSCLIFV